MSRPLPAVVGPQACAARRATAAKQPDGRCGPALHRRGHPVSHHAPARNKPAPRSSSRRTPGARGRPERRGLLAGDDRVDEARLTRSRKQRAQRSKNILTSSAEPVECSVRSRERDGPDTARLGSARDRCVETMTASRHNARTAGPSPSGRDQMDIHDGRDTETLRVGCRRSIRLGMRGLDDTRSGVARITASTTRSRSRATVNARGRAADETTGPPSTVADLPQTPTRVRMAREARPAGPVTTRCHRRQIDLGDRRGRPS